MAFRTMRVMTFKRTLKVFFLGALFGAALITALLFYSGVAHADPYCPGCASPGPSYPEPNQLYPPFGGPPLQWQGPNGQGGCFNYGNTGVHCS